MVIRSIFVCTVCATGCTTKHHNAFLQNWSFSGAKTTRTHILLSIPTDSFPISTSPMCKAETSMKMKSTGSLVANNKKKQVEKKPAAPTKFKKAPGAPRRFKSAFIFFSTQKHKQIRQGLGKAGEKEKVSLIEPIVYL